MARLLTGVTRARTVTHHAVDTSDSVVAPPRPGGGAGVDGVAEPTADESADRSGTPSSYGGERVEEPAGAESGAEPGAGSGGGRFGRFVPGRAGGDRAGFDVRNSWQVIAGSFLVPAGVVIILISWYGAAHTRFVQQQIPYLVSGSFIGLGCMILGGLLYWAHWLYRLYDQADLNHEEMLKAFEQTLRVVADRLTATGGQGVAAPAPGVVPGAVLPAVPAPAGVAAATGSPSAGYVATATGSVYHLPSCPVVAHHGDGLRSLGPADVAGMEPCRICLVARRPSSER